ncbi:DUF4358 domain-containing protein [Clostridium rectalis]|uniref:DUF4358 domain-containing protein n=1 Tax=Clostridium rectalis TaxID=2040295 RepID=UPI000F62F3CB|nr:DUF4358 domain-containing protein [Clostridium rectalis]
MTKNFKTLTKTTLLTSLLVLFSLGIFIGCSSKKSLPKKPSLKDITSKIIENSNMSNLKEADKSKIKKFYDIDSESLEEFSVYLPSSNILANELAVLKVKELSNVDKIKGKLEKRLEKQSTSFKDYLPDEYYLIQKHVLKTKDNYILFVISKDVEKIEEIFDKSFK